MRLPQMLVLSLPSFDGYLVDVMATKVNATFTAHLYASGYAWWAINVTVSLHWLGKPVPLLRNLSFGFQLAWYWSRHFRLKLSESGSQAYQITGLSKYFPLYMFTVILKTCLSKNFAIRFIDCRNSHRTWLKTVSRGWYLVTTSHHVPIFAHLPITFSSIFQGFHESPLSTTQNMKNHVCNC